MVHDVLGDEEGAGYVGFSDVALDVFVFSVAA